MDLYSLNTWVCLANTWSVVFCQKHRVWDVDDIIYHINNEYDLWSEYFPPSFVVLLLKLTLKLSYKFANNILDMVVACFLVFSSYLSEDFFVFLTVRFLQVSIAIVPIHYSHGHLQIPFHCILW